MLQMNLLQGRNRVVDIENGHIDIVGEGEGGINWEIQGWYQAKLA